MVGTEELEFGNGRVQADLDVQGEGGGECHTPAVSQSKCINMSVSDPDPHPMRGSIRTKLTKFETQF